MTNREKALQELLAKVEAGEWDITRDQPSEISGLLDHWHTFYLIMDDGSLDAALALHNAVLPGWGWTFPHKNNAIIYGNSPAVWAKGYHANSAARAWLIAILKALIAGEDE